MRTRHWKPSNAAPINNAAMILRAGGGAVVTPTNVGYIIMTTDKKGLERKFEYKDRPTTKPGVVLLSSIDQLQRLAEISPKILELYQDCWDSNILLGCILPWSKEGISHIPSDGSSELVMDRRETSCFVIKYGIPSEQVASKLWNESGMLSFASSANISGQGNSGKVHGIGEQITSRVDLVVEADPWVARRQPGKTAATRFAQGVMVSMVDQAGNLVDEPVLIRRGLYVDEIMSRLSTRWDYWTYYHGSYH